MNTHGRRSPHFTSAALLVFPLTFLASCSPLPEPAPETAESVPEVSAALTVAPLPASPDSPFTIGSLPPGVYPVSASASGLVIRSTDGSLMGTIPGPDDPLAALSSTGVLAYSSPDIASLLTTDLRTMRTAKLLRATAEGEGFLGPAWLPDASALVYERIPGIQSLSDTGSLWFLGLADATPLQITSWDNAETGPAISPDGRWLAFSASPQGPDPFKHELYIFDLACLPGPAACESSGFKQLTDTAPNVDSREPSWSPDGLLLAYACSGDICIIDRQSLGTSRLLDSTEAEMLPRWSPDGLWILFTRWEGPIRSTYLADPHGGEVRTLSGKDDESGIGWLEVN